MKRTGSEGSEQKVIKPYLCVGEVHHDSMARLEENRFWAHHIARILHAKNMDFCTRKPIALNYRVEEADTDGIVEDMGDIHEDEGEEDDHDKACRAHSQEVAFELAHTHTMSRGNMEDHCDSGAFGRVCYLQTTRQ
jgi:hypothetical protein